MINSIPLLKDNFSPDTLSKLIYFTEELILTNGETLYREDIKDDSSLYFIEKGKVEIFS